MKKFILSLYEVLGEARKTDKCRVIEGVKAIYVSDSAVRIVLNNGDAFIDKTSALIDEKRRHFPDRVEEAA